MTNERYKKIMADLGTPNSKSLLFALQQVANEAGQEAMKDERESCAKECEGLKALYLSQGRSAHEESFLVAAVDDCAIAIRKR